VDGCSLVSYLQVKSVVQFWFWQASEEGTSVQLQQVTVFLFPIQEWRYENEDAELEESGLLLLVFLISADWNGKKKPSPLSIKNHKAFNGTRLMWSEQPKGSSDTDLGYLTQNKKEVRAAKTR